MLRPTLDPQTRRRRRWPPPAPPLALSCLAAHLESGGSPGRPRPLPRSPESSVRPQQTRPCLRHAGVQVATPAGHVPPFWNLAFLESGLSQPPMWSPSFLDAVPMRLPGHLPSWAVSCPTAHSLPLPEPGPWGPRASPGSCCPLFSTHSPGDVTRLWLQTQPSPPRALPEPQRHPPGPPGRCPSQSCLSPRRRLLGLPPTRPGPPTPGPPCTPTCSRTWGMGRNNSGKEACFLKFILKRETQAE